MRICKLNNILMFKYLRWLLDETMSGETMALNVLNKINKKLKFLDRTNNNALIIGKNYLMSI